MSSNIVSCKELAPQMCDACFENVDGEAQRRPERISLGFRESVWQGAKRGAVVLYEEVGSDGEVCEGVALIVISFFFPSLKGTKICLCL